ncbi:fatty acid synthase [Heterostelium album PN500]|uniref:Fatty acid synthase n=1 Tax=Heterostelium pallidum (strain ATCC 26659 / Pp 5 / PN500) TaxID=670386 RepID=D3BEE6_HETP5|nr:fatty acid synthase [Heterostelium album PN500]EFA80277.1 fatty acid synthase [Heterostelium album PN500]|eukprot:XP_020432397.1 fatty acid synthase [Heterostelium album PN500]
MSRRYSEIGEESFIEFSNRYESFKDFAIGQSLLDLSRSSTIRKAIVACDWDDFLQKLSTKSVIATDSNTRTKNMKVIMVISGQGYQTSEMGNQLYKSEPTYKQIVDKIDNTFNRFIGFSIFEKIKHIPSDRKEIFNDQSIAQPALLMFHIGIIELYRHYGIEADITLAQSFGEITAAYVAGCISLETSVKIIYHRSIIKSNDDSVGKMMLVRMSHQLFVEKYTERFPTVEIICYNAPSLFFVSGDPEVIDQLKLLLEQEHIGSIDSLLPGSFHSRKQKALKPKVLSSLSPMDDAQPPKIQWYSTVTGDVYKDRFTAKYVYDNLRRPVKFEQALNSLHRDIKDSFDDHVFLEIAPRPVYSKQIKACIDQFESIISPLQVGKDERISFLESLGSLYCNGIKVDFTKQYTVKELNEYKLKNQ